MGAYNMPKADMHVHSKHSMHPSEWFLQRLGASESYTEPDFIFTESVDKKMDFVTVTDHNTADGSFFLKQKYPDKTFTGVEVTSYFPEDGCKAHILIYGFTPAEFEHIDKIRSDIYELRDYIKSKNLAYSVAHAAYSVNGKLTEAHLEKFILLFDVFESINGSRDRASNVLWTRVLSGLTPEFLEQIYDRHKIEPMSADPWIKGFTGGTDDHAGIFIAKTFTEAAGTSPDGFLASIRDKKSIAHGRHNDFKGLAFAIYKIAYDFSRRKGSGLSGSLLSQLTEYVFEKKKLSFKSEIKVGKAKYFSGDRGMQGLLSEFVDTLKENAGVPIEEKLDIVYDKITAITDEFFKSLLISVQKDLNRGDIVSLIKNVSSSITGIFLAAPFFTTIRHIHENRSVVASFASKFRELDSPDGKRILWFTDTLNDLNGVSVTLKTLGWQSFINKKNIRLVTCLEGPEAVKLSFNVLNLPYIHSFDLPYYEKYSIKVPSILSALKEIYAFEPDEIIISTPGPVGLAGFMAAKLMGIKCTGIYHTDFTSQSQEIIGDESAASIVEAYTRWFYSSMDELKVPSSKYIPILRSRGFETSKMSIFKRGIDSKLFSNRPGGRLFLREFLGITGGIILIFTGRISRDKNLDFLVDVYRALLAYHPSLKLIMAGDGPQLAELKARCSGLEGVFFTGKIQQQMLPVILSGSDIFVFPSTTDTFGMSVLEAQSCGLPAVVSDTGGPQEIIIKGITGLIARSNDINDWIEKISSLVVACESGSPSFLRMKTESSRNAANAYEWNSVLKDLTASVV
jgi:glycosyltransferase involved in cell wall biosynthesis